MELCRADIARLERRGHRAQDFSIIGEDGIPRLRNEGGFCYFFDRQKERCREYASRPLGCVIYPVNLTDDGELMVDELCPEWRSISPEEKAERGKRLRKLLDTIDTEAALRR
jgi:Fe-S-cluster containining protein